MILERSSLDSHDRRILADPQDYPESLLAEPSERVGLSQTPCWRRLKRLRTSGFVAQRAWLLDASRLGLTVNVFAELKLKQHDEETLELLEAAARARPEIIECFSMSGDGDYLLRIVVHDVEEYEMLLKKVLLHLPGVASVNSSFALKPIKVTTRLPI